MGVVAQEPMSKLNRYENLYAIETQVERNVPGLVAILKKNKSLRLEISHTGDEDRLVTSTPTLDDDPRAVLNVRSETRGPVSWAQWPENMQSSPGSWAERTVLLLLLQLLHSPPFHLQSLSRTVRKVVHAPKAQVPDRSTQSTRKRYQHTQVNNHAGHRERSVPSANVLEHQEAVERAGEIGKSLRSASSGVSYLLPFSASSASSTRHRVIRSAVGCADICACAGSYAPFGCTPRQNVRGRQTPLRLLPTPC
ncbi:hypothetical protein J6590_066142 [Homalodisca vitripennis]|nr:hypothetical protein J6590_066142 [Homalodisca vitripennis]